MNNYSGVIQRADGEFLQLLMHNDAVNKEGFPPFSQAGVRRDDLSGDLRLTKTRTSCLVTFGRRRRENFFFRAIEEKNITSNLDDKQQP